MNLNEKIEQFNNLCGDWDFRNIDMTNPHIAGIGFNENTIKVYCELFSPELDDYVSCDGGLIKNKNLINKFRSLNLKNDGGVLDFINDIEDLIDWDKVGDNLYSKVEEENIFEI